MVKEMFDSRSESESCGRGPDAISYLYGEIFGEDRDDFETHLADCANCADEIASFSAISMSLAELHKSASAVPVSSSNERAGSGLFARIRELLAAYPVGVRAFAGAAAAILLLLLGYFAISSFSNGSAEPNIAKDEPAGTGTKKNSGTDDDRRAADVEVADAPEPADREPGSAIPRRAEPEKRVPANRLAKKPRGPVNKPAQNTPVPKDQLAGNDQPLTLSEAGEEDFDDDSLRLTDLFAESGGDR